MDNASKDSVDFVAFAGHERVAKGSWLEINLACRRALDAGECRRLVAFESESGRVRDLDLHGSEEDLRQRLAPPETPRTRGRPKLGVVSKEVSLLPRHWEWLAEQRGGASAALRRLVEDARKHEGGRAKAQRAVEAAHRFLWDMADGLPNFEEATRHLFAFEFDRLHCAVVDWPIDVRHELDHFIERAKVAHAAAV